MLMCAWSTACIITVLSVIAFFWAVKHCLQLGIKENNDFYSTADNAVCYINKGISSAV